MPVRTQMIYQVQYNNGTTKAPRWVVLSERPTRLEANAYLIESAQAQYDGQVIKTVSLDYFASRMRVKGRRV